MPQTLIEMFGSQTLTSENFTHCLGIDARCLSGAGYRCDHPLFDDMAQYLGS
jgi:hypothetical protein